MKFKIIRTSQIFDCEEKHLKPCDEAFLEDGRWLIEIKTLEDLITFTKKYGKIILEKDYCSKEVAIEIYDDFRE